MSSDISKTKIVVSFEDLDKIASKSNISRSVALNLLINNLTRNLKNGFQEKKGEK